MSIGANVRWRRLAMGLTQAELARRVYIDRKHPDRSWLCRLEQDKVDPKLSQVRALARALGVKPWQLIAEIYENPDFWEQYIALAPAHKRAVQRLIDWYYEGRS